MLGEVAAKGAAMIDIRCGRCDRHGRLSVTRLLAEWGADASLRDKAPAVGTTVQKWKEIQPQAERNGQEICVLCPEAPFSG